MLLIRRFEERAAEIYQRAEIGGYRHLNLGQEATCVGLVAGMGCGDYLFTNHQEHGYARAPGIQSPPHHGRAVRAGGRGSKARDGSMDLFDADKRLTGGYRIAGGQPPLSTGGALALVRQGRQEVVLCQRGTARPTSAPSTSR
jgi:pyruvate dehydrogenase E1 component alpha subunit